MYGGLVVLARLLSNCQVLLCQSSKCHRGLDNLQDLGYTVCMEMRDSPIFQKLKKVKKPKNRKSQILRFLSF